MRKMRNFIAIGIALTFIAASCTVQKRVHNNGYHVAWNIKHKSGKQQEVSTGLNSNESIAKATQKQTNKIKLVESNSAIKNVKEQVKQPTTSSSKVLNETKSNQSLLNTYSSALTEKENDFETKINTSKLVKKIASNKNIGKQIQKTQKKSDFGDIILNLIYIILLIILIVVLLSLIGGLLGSLLSLLFLILIVVFILKLLGII